MPYHDSDTDANLHGQTEAHQVSYEDQQSPFAGILDADRDFARFRETAIKVAAAHLAAAILADVLSPKGLDRQV